MGQIIVTDGMSIADLEAAIVVVKGEGDTHVTAAHADGVFTLETTQVDAVYDALVVTLEDAQAAVVVAEEAITAHVEA